MSKSDAITLKQLRALRAIVECGTITGAAEATNLTTPAVHMQLKSLEENLDAKLVNRTTGGITSVTPAGEAVLDAAHAIEVALSRCLRRVSAIHDGLSGVVFLGVVSTGKYFAPALVAQIQKNYPDVEIVLRIGNRDAILAALEARTVDLAIMGRPPREPLVHSDVIGPHPQVIIARPDHPLADRDDITPDELLQETFLAREEGSGTRILMTRFLDQFGDGRPFRTIEMGTNETIKQAVIAGLGIALISLHTVTNELQTKRLVTLKAKGLPIERRWFLIHPMEPELHSAADTVRKYILSQNGSFLP